MLKGEIDEIATVLVDKLLDLKVIK